MKKLVVMTKKEWKRFQQNTATAEEEIRRAAYERGYAYGRAGADVLAAALWKLMLISDPVALTVVDVRNDLVGKVGFKVAVTDDKNQTVQLYHKSLLPES